MQVQGAPLCTICNTNPTRPLKNQPKNATQVKYTLRCDSCVDGIANAYRESIRSKTMPKQDASTQTDSKRKRYVMESDGEDNVNTSNGFASDEGIRAHQELQRMISRVTSTIDRVVEDDPDKWVKRCKGIKRDLTSLEQDMQTLGTVYENLRKAILDQF